MKQVIYITNPKSQKIYVWLLNTEGLLTLLQIVHVPGEGQPMAISYSKRFLYVGECQKFRILTYYISSGNGILNLISETFISSRPTYISSDNKEKFLFVASYENSCLSVLCLENGIPKETVNKINGLKGCHAVSISPDNHTLWVPALKQDRICLFSIENTNKDGVVLKTTTEVTTSIGAGPRHVAFHPNQKYIYVINELNSSIDIWQSSINNKEVTLVDTLNILPSCFSGKNWASDIHITPNGRYLYACDRTASLITIFSVSKDGSMLKIEGFQSTETQPRSFAIDYTGKYLIITGQKAHYITLYKIQETQGLLEKKGRYFVDFGASWVVINAF